MISYGLIAGIGVGIAYGVPLVVAARWLSDRFGLAVGMTVVGFGLSPLVTAPLAFTLIIAFCIFWFCLGAWLAVAPAATPSFFDLNNYPSNYGKHVYRLWYWRVIRQQLSRGYQRYLWQLYAVFLRDGNFSLCW